MTKCIVKDEGTKKSGTYHVFGIYLSDITYCDRGPSSSVLLRLSTDNHAEAEQWMSLLQLACQLNDSPTSTTQIETLENTNPMRLTGYSTESTSATNRSHKSQSCNSLSLISAQITPPINFDSSDFSSRTKDRVEAASMTLRKSRSRRLLTDSTTHLSAADVAPTSPVNKSSLSKKTAKKKSKSSSRSYPASKPIHTQCMPSPLSSDVRPGEQNYRYAIGISEFMNCR